MQQIQLDALELMFQTHLQLLDIRIQEERIRRQEERNKASSRLHALYNPPRPPQLPTNYPIVATAGERLCATLNEE